MLILTRKVDQEIYIGLGISIRILGVERDRVKIGIDAPKNVAIVRGELLQRDYDKAKDWTP